MPREVCVLGTPSICLAVCVCVCLDRPSGSSNTVENASNAAVKLWLFALSSGWQPLVTLKIIRYIEEIFFAMRRDHVLYNKCGSAVQTTGYYCSKSVSYM